LLNKDAFRNLHIELLLQVTVKVGLVNISLSQDKFVTGCQGIDAPDGDNLAIGAKVSLKVNP